MLTIAHRNAHRSDTVMAAKGMLPNHGLLVCARYIKVRYLLLQQCQWQVQEMCWHCPNVANTCALCKGKGPMVHRINQYDVYYQGGIREKQHKWGAGNTSLLCYHVPLVRLYTHVQTTCQELYTTLHGLRTSCTWAHLPCAQHTHTMHIQRATRNDAIYV